MQSDLDIDSVRNAHLRIQGTAERNSPVTRTPTLCHRTPLGRTLWLKAENFQTIGAFKIRGAVHFISRLDHAPQGIITASSGNHAQAVARAAKEQGLRALIVMPNDAPRIKRIRVEADGAAIVVVGPDSDERLERAQEESQRLGWPFIPPYDHPDIIAGQGTAALEACEDLADQSISAFYCPVGGGGIMAGSSIVLNALKPQTQVIGVEPEAADDFNQSFKTGERVRIPPPQTVADGLRARIPGVLPFEILKRNVHQTTVVTDEQIFDAIAYALRQLRIVLEPSGAVALAAALNDDADHALVMLTGGNVDEQVLQQVLSRRPSSWETPTTRKS